MSARKLVNNYLVDDLVSPNLSYVLDTSLFTIFIGFYWFLN